LGFSTTKTQKEAMSAAGLKGPTLTMLKYQSDLIIKKLRPSGKPDNLEQSEKINSFKPQELSEATSQDMGNQPSSIEDIGKEGPEERLPAGFDQDDENNKGELTRIQKKKVPDLIFLQ